MKTLNTIAGKTYVVTSPNGCTVTDETGLTLGTVEAGQQKVFVATGAKLQADDDSARITATFNSAPAKLMALGLLGGGAQTLPAGYIAAEFLENTNDSYMSLPLSFNTKGNKIEVDFYAYFTQSYEQSATEGHQNLHHGAWDNKNYVFEGMGIVRATGSLPFYEWVNYKMSVHNLVVTFYTHSGEEKTFTASKDVSVPSWMLWKYGDFRYVRCRRKNYILKINGEKKVDLIPAIDEAGSPCFFDKKSKQSFYNEATTPLIVGLTLPQARKLSKLPATGGTLTISLPSNWQEDAGVVNALATAEANGWVLTYQTYEADASTASTFALRRIFVRKTQNENGQYIDADGTRWHVEWCAGMIGAEPTEHGYEPFRSVDAAVAYWELTPWVDPEQEDLLTNSTTND